MPHLHPRTTVLFVLLFVASTLVPASLAIAQPWQTLYGGLRSEASRVTSESLDVPLTEDHWEATEQERREKWLEMLGLSPLPERSPLKATVTGTLDRGDYIVEKLHFQSLPGAYVTGNLYRPAKPPQEKLPAVLYLCGHSQGKVNPRYQAHPRWFAQHGYVSLVLDPIQLGEMQGFHHGTYRGQRWDWPSRGYTPAGTEVWNAIRALDYLQTRSDVDGERLGVTGLSGGGVISWCLGAADARVKVVVPVCQSGSIQQVVTDRSTDGHCDCAFWINYYQWCWPDIGALIAPRALMIASGSEDILWRPDGYLQTAYRLRRQYEQLDVPDRFAMVQDVSRHGYTPKLRLAIFTWFNTHLKNDPTPVTEDITDFVEPEENLLVFGGTLPSEDQMTRVDELLVKNADIPQIKDKSDWQTYQRTALQKLKQTTFRHSLSNDPPHRLEFRSDGRDQVLTYGSQIFQSVDGMTVTVKTTRPIDSEQKLPVLAFAVPESAEKTFAGGSGSRPSVDGAISTAAVEVRNTGATSVGPGYLWTARRSYPLLGESLPERQVADLLAAVKLIREDQSTSSVSVYGKGPTAAQAIYAAVLDPEIREVVLNQPPKSHRDPETAEFLGVLRVGDLPQNLALVFPRPITFIGEIPEPYRWTQRLYERLGAGDRIRILPSVRQWQPSQTEQP
ncbi:hypothetical protein FYK55_12630 [Roseiconus nitratireducens]|uniref:Uncharacterized protein n=1 Tax=Roseiconus nitratireducens TaxID=2605748 RepID=A0A5M6D6G7_9BACT|nr:acetylxylan esterase [Roseiconus nitratireducens]KAA5543124.1 hypothetical protein FYK55_12630 [Roseiconus nitratireducens]